MNYRVKLIDYFRQRDRGRVLALVVLITAVYAPFLGNAFFFDDLSFFTIGLPEIYQHGWFDFTLRWFPYALFGRMDAVFSSELPHAYRLADMLLHAANTVLLFYFLRQLLSAVPLPSSRPFNVARTAWFAAAIFAVHPVAAFAAGYAIQVSILMATTFSLVMLMAYLRGLLSGEGRWFVLAALAYFLACFSKEHSVLMPAVALAMGWLVRPKRRATGRMLWVTWGAFAAIAAVVTLRAYGVFGQAYEPMAAQLFAQLGIEQNTRTLHLLSAFTQAGLFFKYLLLWALPEPTVMSLDMRELFVGSLSNWQGWVAGIAFLAYGAVALRFLLLGGWVGLAGFAMLYSWLLFWVELSGVRVQEPFVVYRSYLWMPGGVLLVSVLFARWPERKAMLAMLGILFVLVLLSWQRLQIFGDRYRLWNEAATLLPGSRVGGADRIFFNRGQAEVAAGKLDAAIADFRRSLAISPQYAPVHGELGWAYVKNHQGEEALSEFDAAIALNPAYADSYYGKALVLKAQQKDQEAAEIMAKSCELGQRMACLLSKGSTERR